MEIILRNRSLIFVLIGLVAFATFTAVTSASSARELTASGRGILPAGTAKDGSMIEREFTFNAHARPDGKVEGMGMLYNPAEGETAQPYVLQIDISCMNVVGDVIFFGGSTHRTTDPNLADAVYFSVQDNGEPGAEKDKMSRVYFFDDDPNTTGDPQLCKANQPGDFAMEPILSGDISIGD
jgi:hypothetical protein